MFTYDPWIRIRDDSYHHHNLFGWVTLVAATAHGVYFLFHRPMSWSEFYSGVGAWIALVLLAVSGMLMGNVARRPVRARVSRISHIALTVGYAGAVILHFHAGALLGGILFAAAFAAMGLMWVIMKLAQATKRFGTHYRADARADKDNM